MAKNLLTGFLVSLVAGQTVWGGSLLDLKSSPLQQNLVELYSSEGCSSCPPAENWMGSLRKEPGLWKKFVPVEFHVDYWDGLGWKDPYASKQFTDRQRSYSARWSSENVYTPELVFNGTEWAQWRFEGLSKIDKYGSEVGVLQAKEESKRSFLVRFTPAKKIGNKAIFLNSVLLGRNSVSHVSRGENSGRTLKHDFLALALKKTNLKSVGQSLEARVSFDEKDVRVSSDSYSIVFWVTDEAEKPIQSLGGDL